MGVVDKLLPLIVLTDRKSQWWHRLSYYLVNIVNVNANVLLNNIQKRRNNSTRLHAKKSEVLWKARLTKVENHILHKKEEKYGRICVGQEHTRCGY